MDSSDLANDLRTGHIRSAFKMLKKNIQLAKFSFTRRNSIIFLMLTVTNAILPTDAAREQHIAAEEKKRKIANAKCQANEEVSVQLNRGGIVAGPCLFLSVGYITMRVGKQTYSFSLEGDVADILQSVESSTATDEQLRSFEVKRLESQHAIGIRFLDLNLIEDPFKFGKIALNYEYRFWFLSVFLEGGADFKAGVAQNTKKYDGMAQMRWLFSKAFDTFYVGAFVNYQNGTTVQNDADSQKRDVEISAYGLGALMGKKWVLGSGVFLDLTLRAGPYFETILSRAANYRYTAGDEATGTAFRAGLGGIALTFSLGYVF